MILPIVFALATTAVAAPLPQQMSPEAQKEIDQLFGRLARFMEQN